MKYCFITGSSKGLGKAIVEVLLAEGWTVHGLSRSNTIEHENYFFHQVDLSDVTETASFNFPVLKDAEKIVLINNAGILGSVNRCGNLNEAAIVSAINVNFTSLTILCNSFINSFRKYSASKTIINVSSGAGKSAIDGWSIYCGTKAAVDHFTRVLSQEQTVKNEGFTAFSVAPGIVDTEMQTQIRSAEKSEFSRIDDFLRYKERGELADAKFVAHKFLYILDNTEKFKDTVFSVRDF